MVSSTENYLQAEFGSAVFRFVDDVEFLADEAAGVIQVRSASRVGSGDLGVIRRLGLAAHPEGGWFREIRGGNLRS